MNHAVFQTILVETLQCIISQSDCQKNLCAWDNDTEQITITRKGLTVEDALKQVFCIGEVRCHCRFSVLGSPLGRVAQKIDGDTAPPHFTTYRVAFTPTASPPNTGKSRCASLPPANDPSPSGRFLRPAHRWTSLEWYLPAQELLHPPYILH